MIWIRRLGSTWPRVLCNWNSSEVKEGILKIHYERENKENPSNNAIKETNEMENTKQKRNKEMLVK